MLEFAVPRGVWRPLWELWVRVGLPARRAADLARLARGRALPRPEHPRVLGAPRPRRALPGRPGSTTCRPGGSASAAGSSSGADARERRDAARVLRARAGRLARLRHAPPSAVHAVASLLRRGRRRPCLAVLVDALRGGARRFRARDGRRRARARRAARPAAPNADPRARRCGRSPSRRSQARSRRDLRVPSRGRRGSRRSSSSARSSSSPTTSSSSAARSTRRCGSRSRGDRCPRSPRTSSRRRRWPSGPRRGRVRGPALLRTAGAVDAGARGATGSGHGPSRARDCVEGPRRRLRRHRACRAARPRLVPYDGSRAQVDVMRIVFALGVVLAVADGSARRSSA